MRTSFLPAVAALVCLTLAARAQDSASRPAAAPASPVTLKQLGLLIYPAKGQTPDQQAKDEAACYHWAETETGIKLTGQGPDVAAAGEAAREKTDSATRGAAVAGAARGAAGGAIIGAIAGDAGEGAAIGAVAGAVGGRRARKKAAAQAEQQGQQQAKAQQQAMVDQFKKAAAVCLEGRGYTAK